MENNNNNNGCSNGPKYGCPNAVCVVNGAVCYSCNKRFCDECMNDDGNECYFCNKRFCDDCINQYDCCVDENDEDGCHLINDIC